MLQISKPGYCADGSLNASAQILVERHLPFARRAASKAARKFGVAFDDLLSAACIGLTDAAPKFDPNLGFAFATYAIRPVMNRIRDECASVASVVRRPRGAPSSSQDEASQPKPSVTVICRPGRGASIHTDAHLDAFDGDGLDMLIGASESPESLMAATDQSAAASILITQAMTKLNDRERVIIIARKIADEPATLHDLGLKYRVSTERVRQIETAALKKMTAFVLRQNHAVSVKSSKATKKMHGLEAAKDTDDDIVRFSILGQFSLDQSPEPETFVAKMRRAAQ
jgi:RNA polymerase sigma-32 factor